MNLTQIRVEIEAPREKVWQLITEPKEMEMWSPTLRDLSYDPPGPLQVGTLRKAQIESGGKIQAYTTKVTHCEYLEYFTEVAQGVNPFGMERIKSIQLTYRLEAEEENRTAFIFTAQYDIPGFLGRLINKTIGEGMLRAAVKQNFERLKTYAETGRSV